MTDGDGCQRDNAKSNHPGKISPTSLIHHVVRFFSPRKNFSYFFFFVSFFLSQWWWWWRSVMVVALSPLLIFRIYLMILIMFCVCVCSCFRVFFFTWCRDRGEQSGDSRRTIWPDPPFWRQVLNCLETPSHLTTFYIGTDCIWNFFSFSRLGHFTKPKHTNTEKSARARHESAGIVLKSL